MDFSVQPHKQAIEESGQEQLSGADIGSGTVSNATPGSSVFLKESVHYGTNSRLCKRVFSAEYQI